MFKNAFRWGRTTASTCEFAQGRLPQGEEGCPALTTKLAERLFKDFDHPVVEPQVQARRASRPALTPWRTVQRTASQKARSCEMTTTAPS